MRKLIIAISSLALFGAVAHADPVADRKALMKANGAAVGALSGFVKGEKPYDASAALEALTKLRDDAAMMDPATLWPEGSGVGDTTSSPKIWEDKAGFEAAIAKFQADTAAAVTAAPADVEALKVQFDAVTSNCGGCHQVFRVKKG